VALIAVIFRSRGREAAGKAQGWIERERGGRKGRERGKGVIEGVARREGSLGLVHGVYNLSYAYACACEGCRQRHILGGRIRTHIGRVWG